MHKTPKGRIETRGKTLINIRYRVNNKIVFCKVFTIDYIHARGDEFLARLKKHFCQLDLLGE